MRAMACVYLAAVCLGAIGCNLFGRKTEATPTPPPGQAAGATWPPRAAETGPATTVPAGVNGLLAGRVLDSYDHYPPATYIRVVPAQEERNGKAEPVEVTANEQGYFTILGLKPGQHYQLIARTRDGERKLAGTTWATPPNPRVLIYMSEDFATPNTPAAPAPPSVPGQKEKPSPPSSVPPPSWPDGSTSSGERGNGSAGGVGIGTPLRPSDDRPRPGAPANAVPTPPPAEIRPESITDATDKQARISPPLADIHPLAPLGRPQPAMPAAEPPAAPAAPSRVPWCLLIGQQLDNFALYDLNGQPWQYRRHDGRIVLLDFWGTWCIPCLQAIPHLKIFQQKYGPYGLEVIGIAYEQEGSLREQIRKVERVRDLNGIKYRLLLGGDMMTCEVKKQFGVTHFPTLVLLNDKNRIIWKEEGLPDAYKLQDLELLIQRELRRR